METKRRRAYRTYWLGEDWGLKERYSTMTAAQVTALDVNEEVLDIARAKRNASKVRYQKGSAYDIPDFGRTHDALLAGHWWSHVLLDALDAFLLQAAARVAPGALIVFFDNRYVEGSSTPLSHKDAAGNTYQARKLDDGSTHEVLKNFPGKGEWVPRKRPPSLMRR